MQSRDRFPNSEYRRAAYYLHTSVVLTILIFFHLLIDSFSLEERKKQWQKEEEERRRNAPDPNAPPGHTLMPESERKETLISFKNGMSAHCQCCYIESETCIVCDVFTSIILLMLIFLFVCFFSAHHSLVTELLSLPLKADTLSVRSRQAHLERKLSEIEEAIKIFSRDKVYVKIDS